MRSFLAATLVLSTAALVHASADPAHAVGTTCRGQTPTAFGTDGDDDLTGTPLADVVVLGAGSDKFRGLGGNDVICGEGGRDVVFGGDGNDVLVGAGGGDRLVGGAGDDQVAGGKGKDELVGGADEDLVRGGPAPDYLAEGPGDDQLAGGGGGDFLSYLTFTDGPVDVDVASAVVDGAGHDFFGGVETIEGTILGDVMRGSAGGDDLRGAGGDDDISGFAGNDVLFGAGGTVTGGAGNDYFHLKASTDAAGGDGADQFDLAAGPVHASGGPGTDRFLVLSVRSEAVLDGDAATNQIDFSGFRRRVRLSLGAGTAEWRGGSLHFSGVRNAVGSRYDDVLAGSSAADYLDALKGDDVLRGRGGNDFLIGRRGYDRGYGESGWDICLTEARIGCER